jgi:nitrite reductase (NADH) large subunit
MKVVVVGAGVAGSRAAHAAASLEAEVTVLESGTKSPVPRSLLLQLLEGKRKSPELRKIEEDNSQEEDGISFRFGETAVAFDSTRSRIKSDRRTIPYDSLVLATGSTFIDEHFRGDSRKGLIFLREIADFELLDSKAATVSRIAVLGSGALSVEIAEILQRRKVQVTLFSPGGVLGGSVSEPIASAVRHKMAEAGVKLVPETVDSVAGEISVEAILSKGRVFASEGLVVIPRSGPNNLKSNCTRGRAGGILVDRGMNTSEKNIFAAGDCAEQMLKSTSFASKLHSVARIMGEVAGENSAGANRVASISGVLGFSAFDLQVCTAGITEEEARRAALPAREVTFSGRAEKSGAMAMESICTLVFEPGSRQILGIQILGQDALRLSDFSSIVVSQSLTLDDVAFYDSPYLHVGTRDVSPISVAARAALRG